MNSSRDPVRISCRTKIAFSLGLFAITAAIVLFYWVVNPLPWLFGPPWMERLTTFTFSLFGLGLLMLVMSLFSLIIDNRSPRRTSWLAK
jgi:hypothetical protein